MVQSGELINAMISIVILLIVLILFIMIITKNRPSTVQKANLELHI